MSIPSLLTICLAEGYSKLKQTQEKNNDKKNNNKVFKNSNFTRGMKQVNAM